MAELVTSRIEDGVALVTLNRPERMNAFDLAMGAAFDQVMAEVGLNPEARVVVLTGAGERAFCAGGDIARLDAILAGRETHIQTAPSPLEALDYASPGLRRRYTSPMALRQPVICALNGIAAGAGFALAAACDLRFASETAGFAALFVQRGLVAESALAWNLTQIVGRGIASDILLSGRRVAAAEAQAIRLVNAVTPPERLLDHALDYARAMARNCSPRSMAVIKRQIRMVPRQTPEEAYDLAFDETTLALKSGDFAEAMASFHDKREPRFSGS